MEQSSTEAITESKTETVDAPPLEAPKTPIDKSNLYFELDYDKVKQDLKQGDKAAKLKLLQALRWVRSGNQKIVTRGNVFLLQRITQSNETFRNMTVESYIKNDLLGLITPDTSFVEGLYCPPEITPNPIQV